MKPAIEIIKTNKILGEKISQWREFLSNSHLEFCLLEVVNSRHID
jgi:hypothetical protein